jgi:hypothetical protein
VTAGTVIVEQVLQLAAAQAAPGELRFDASTNQVIAVHATQPGGSLVYRLQLLDKFNTSLVSLTAQAGRSSEAVSELTLPYDGAYRVLVTPTEGEGTLQVTVSAVGAATGGGYLEHLPLHFGGAFEARDVFHVYQFPLQRGDTVRIAASSESETLKSLGLSLIGPDGQAIVDSGMEPIYGPGESVLPRFTASMAGTYLAIVTNLDEETGRYTFDVALSTEPLQPEGPPDIGYDQAFPAAFANDSVLHAGFDGAAGDVLRIEVLEPEEDLDLDIYLLSPFGQIIAYAVDSPAGEGESLNEVQLPYTGRYTLDLRPHGSGEASFRIVRLPATALTGGGSFGDALGGRLSGTFNASDVFHAFQFRAEADDRISVRIEPTGGLALGFSLLSPSGEEATSDQAVNPGDLPPEIQGFRAVQTGTFTVVVHALNGTSGSYDLVFSRD